MNQVTNPAAAAVGALASLRKNIAGVRAALPTSAGDPYLRLLRDGCWVFGAEDHPVKDGTEAVVNVLSIEHGFTCWTRYDDDPATKGQKNTNLGEEMVPLSAPALQIADLPVHPFPWVPQIAFVVKFLDGPHSGKQVKYKASSEGGRTATKGLLDAIMARLDEHEGDFVYPVISLNVDSYRHKSYGKTYIPVFDILAWADMNGNEEDAGEGDAVAELPAPEPEKAPEPEPAPVSPRRARAAAPAAEPEPAPEPEVIDAAPADSPVRRRRRG